MPASGQGGPDQRASLMPFLGRQDLANLQHGDLAVGLNTCRPLRSHSHLSRHRNGTWNPVRCSAAALKLTVGTSAGFHQFTAAPLPRTLRGELGFRPACQISFSTTSRLVPRSNIDGDRIALAYYLRHPGLRPRHLMGDKYPRHHRRWHRRKHFRARDHGTKQSEASLRS